MNFKELVRRGECKLKHVHDFVSFWHSNHKSLSSDSLHEFLGMAEDDYEKWVEDPNKLAHALSDGPVVYTVGAVSQYEENLPTFKLAGGTVWQDREQAEDMTEEVYIHGSRVEGACYPVDLPNGMDDVEWDSDGEEKGELKVKARVLV